MIREPALSSISAGLTPALRVALIRYAREAPLLAFAGRDPVSLCHRYPAPEDREVVALVAALLAFGRVDAFLPRVEALLERMGPHPRRYLEAFNARKDRAFFASFRLRLWKGEDIRFLFQNLKELLREHATVEEAFLSHGKGCPRKKAHRARLTGLARDLHRADPRPITGSRRPPRYYRHLVVNPGAGSACKRWNLFLRWVVRPADGVDLGLWRRVSPGDLVIPLDVHVGRISRLIGLRSRLTLDWRAAEEVTAALLQIDPSDPLRFDLPLSHLGISGGCRGRYLPPTCDACGIRRLCSVYGGRDREGLLNSGPLSSDKS